MSSIIEGYNYDIFISYRQKDNKHDGWVTEFVDNLKGELESTFKEEISVYFDINPHDGLLETHDVDESLKEKLKCLVFIPIISRTYCDPKSFAWEHEFKAFVEMASKDHFGLKIKLPNGNVASRVLPVRIYDLDNTDIRLCESVLGGVLRGLDFVFKSPGVNRPLKPSDDPNKNLNDTFYLDQINKVTNAIREIIYCLNPEPEKSTDHKEYPLIEKHLPKESIPVSHNIIFTFKRLFKSIHGKLTFNKRSSLILMLIFLLMVILVIWGLREIFSNNFRRLPTYATIPVEFTTIGQLGEYPYFSISPDGRTIAYSSVKGIQLRSLSNFSVKLLEGTERATLIIFSPDGQSLAFSKDGQIYKIGINGGPISMVYSQNPSGGLSWGMDGYIYFCPGYGHEGIWRISHNGGNPEQISSVIDNTEGLPFWPQLLPDSKTLLYTIIGPSTGSVDSKIAIQQLYSRERKILIDKAISGYYLSNGNILFANNEGNIFIIPFDLHKLKISGEPRTVLSSIHTGTWSGKAFISISLDGNLVFLPRNKSLLNVIDVVDRAGKLIYKDSVPSKILERIGFGWSSLRVSPSGNLIACTGRSFGIHDIWLINLNTWNTERITFNPTEDEVPVWSPDGKAIAYTSSGPPYELYIKNLESSESPHLIRTWPRHIHFSSWSPDGKWLAAYDNSTTNGTDCYIISVDSGDSVIVAAGQHNELCGQFSPDGNWLAFESDESGRFEIYLVSFPGLAKKRQISNDGGIQPLWDRRGKYIYYLNDDYLMAQPIEIWDEIEIGKPAKLFFANASNFDISPDGQKFYLIRENEKRSNPSLNLILNWYQEFDNKTSK